MREGFILKYPTEQKKEGPFRDAEGNLRENQLDNVMLLARKEEGKEMYRDHLARIDEGRIHLVTAVEALAQHKPFYSSKISETVLEGYLNKPNGLPAAEPPVSRLTDRERQIVQLLAEGRSNKEVADNLAISAKTVETHRAAIMRKLDLPSLADLVRYAIRNNIIEP